MDKIIHLSLTRKNVPTRIDVVQYATKPSIIFVLEDFTPGSGARANLYIEKPDGTKIYNACTISGNQITYKPTTQSFAALGKNKCQLQIIESNGTAVSFLIYADVTENIIDASAVESQDEFTALEQALQEVESIEGSINTLQKGTLASGVDFNNVEVGTWNLASASTYSNAPSDYAGGGILVVSKTSTNGRIIEQLYTQTRAWFRVWNTVTWGEWQDVSALNQGVLPNNTDFDNVINEGQWAIPTANDYGHEPPGRKAAGGILSNTFAGGITVQIAYLHTRVMWLRTRFSDTWRPWARFTPSPTNEDTISIPSVNYVGRLYASSKTLSFFVPMSFDCRGMTFTLGNKPLLNFYHPDGYLQADLSSATWTVSGYVNGISITITTDTAIALSSGKGMTVSPNAAINLTFAWS